MAISVPKYPIRARSPGASCPIISAHAAPSNGRFAAMLPLTSIRMISRIGCGVLSNTVNGCGLPLSNT
jgi:hypothetical protein